MPTYVGAQVIDMESNQPAVGIDVALRLPDGSTKKGKADADGRVRVDADLTGGGYTFTLETGTWFAAQSRPTCYPSVSITVDVGKDEDFLVTVLLGPYSYTTFRGRESVDPRPGWLKALS